MRLDWTRSATGIGLSGVLAALALASGAAGCSTALSTVQTAETLPKGHWHVGSGMDVGVPVSRIADALDAAADIEKKVRDQGTNYTPTDEDRQRYADAAIGLALSSPGVGMDLMVRYGLGHRFDLGVRYTTTGIHGDLKYQFLGEADGGAHGWNGALSLGYANHKFEGLIFDVLELVQIDDFSRNDLEVPVIFGRRFGQFGRVWLGPKFVAAKVHVDATLTKLDATLQTDGWIYYYGGFAGISGGYKGIEAFFELTAMEMIAKPTIFDRKRDLGGLVIMPSVGVMARF